MRKPRPLTKVWVSSSTLRRVRYAQIVRNSRGFLSDGFFEDIEKRRAAAGGLRLAICAVQIPIFVVFALSLIPGEASPSALVTMSRELREILLTVSATLGLCIAVAGYYHDTLSDVISAHLDARAEGNADAREMLRLSWGLDFFPLPQNVEGHLELGSGYGFVIGLFRALSAVTLFLLALAAIFVRFKVMEDVYFAPTFSTAVSLWVIGFVVITDALGSIIFILGIGPIRAKNSEEHEADRSSPEKEARR